MVFNTIANDVNTSKLALQVFSKQFSDIRRDFVSTKNPLGGLFTKGISKNDLTLLQKFDAEIKSGISPSKAFKNNLLGVGSATKKMSVEIAKGDKNIEDISSGFSTMTLKARAAELGMNALKIAGNMALMFIATELISIPFRIAEANKEAVAAATEGAKALDEESKSIDGYKGKISELQTALQSGNLTQGEAYDKRRELISIQDELIGKYGTEKDVVDKVTAAIKGNVNVLDEFNEKSWNSWYSKNNTSGFLQTISGSGSAISKAKNFIEGNNDAYYQGQFTGTTKSKNIYDILSKDKIEQIGNDNGLYTSLGTEAGVFLGGTPEKMLSALKEFRTQYIEALQGQFPATWEDEAKASLSSIDNQIQYFQKGVDTYKLTYQTYMQGKIAYESEYSDEYATILEKRSALEEAQLSGDVENTKKAKSELFYSLTDAMTESKDDAAVLKYFNEMYPELQSEFKKWKFEIGFEANTDNLKTEVSNALVGLDGLDDQGILNIGQIEGTENQEAAYDGLCKSAKKYEIEIEDLIALLVEWGLVQGKVVNEAPPLAQFDISTLTSGIDALKASSEAIVKAYAEMNSESGELSLDTAKELITLDKDYLALLDTKNGKITIGTDILEQQFEIEKKTKIASIEGEKAKLIASQAAIKSAIDSANAEILAMSAVYNMSDSIYRDAMAKLGKSKSDLAENEKSIVDVDKALSVLNTISLGDFASGQKSAKSATDALTASLNKQKKALDEQKAALDKQKAKQDSALRAVNKLLDDEIKKLEEQKAILADPEVAGSYGQRIKAIQDEMDALNAANDAREQAINLEKAQAEAERANSQKVHRIYREGIGFVWNTDQDAIAEANDKLEKIKLDKQLADLEAAKKKLQDTLAAEQKALDDNIKKLQGYKEKWGEISSAYQEAQDRIAAAQQIGADWESKVLNGRLDALEGFKTKYLAIQDELARKAEEIEAINKRIADAQNNAQANGKYDGKKDDGKDDGKGDGKGDGSTVEKSTYEDWLANNPKPTPPAWGGQPDHIWKQTTEYKQYKASLYAWENSKHFAGFKNGTMCSPEGYANLHEEGSELVIPPPVNGHIEYLKYGTKVLPFDLSQKLMDMALDNPIMPDMRSLTMPDLQLSPIINNRGQEIHDIHFDVVMNGVQNQSEFVNMLKHQGASILTQLCNEH